MLKLKRNNNFNVLNQGNANSIGTVMGTADTYINYKHIDNSNNVDNISSMDLIKLIFDKTITKFNINIVKPDVYAFAIYCFKNKSNLLFGGIILTNGYNTIEKEITLNGLKEKPIYEDKTIIDFINDKNIFVEINI